MLSVLESFSAYRLENKDITELSERISFNSLFAESKASLSIVQ